MSGTFQDINVPPTLVSFAVDMALEQDIITPELKKAGNKLVKKEAFSNLQPVFGYKKRPCPSGHSLTP